MELIEGRGNNKENIAISKGTTKGCLYNQLIQY